MARPLWSCPGESVGETGKDPVALCVAAKIGRTSRGVTHARPHGQLSSWVRLLTTAEMPIGSSSDPDFIQPQGCGIDVFVDISGVKQARLSGLKEGQVVEYEEVANRGKTSVENLKV